MDKFPKRFNHQDIEKKWYDIWEKGDYFTAHPESQKPPFCIVIPPPNVTGVLHIGHALNNTIQDIISRFKRMDGYDVLWLPGTDHAGIATENVVEKELLKKGIKKQEIGRENFIKEVWKWREEKGSRIIYQLKRLGAGCDWTRLRFTMDEGLSRAVFEAFERLYREGLIYRGNYIINWCPRCHTALSDLEVEQSKEKGYLYYIRYPFRGKSDWVSVATTRPETMLGDTAVAFHPEDERYKNLKGELLILPLLKRELPLIADKFVDPKFGTGAVKITPAHDFNDFLVAQRHNLPFIKVIDENAVITREGGKYKGMTREEARDSVLKDLEKEGALEKIEDYDLIIGRCYRCKTIVEPLLSSQWFVKMKPLAERAIKEVKDGHIKIIPEMWKNSYFHWLENIRDWCISRQIWWGHRIPVWYCSNCNNIEVSRDRPRKCSSCGGSELKPDENVLDTWFSSSLWPFSTLGWPDKTRELEKYYPTSVLVSAFDILFFWVAKMIMMGLEFMKEVPFRDVYIHPLIRDEKGEKMSKSRGNVIDPLEVMHKYGTDALRFTLSLLASQGKDIKLSESKILSSRNFITKLWNASRYIFINAENNKIKQPQKLKLLSSVWILTLLKETIGSVRLNLENYEFDQAAGVLYRFTWSEFCDWYIEISKNQLKENKNKEEVLWVLSFVILNLLKMLHPFVPFVSEEIHSRLFPQEKTPLIISKYPGEEDIPFSDPSTKERMGRIIDIITEIRNIKSLYSIKLSEPVSLLLRNEKEAIILSSEESSLIKDLAGVKEIEFKGKEYTPEKGVSRSVIGSLEIFIPVAHTIDVGKEVEKLHKKLNSLNSRLKILENKLKNENFIRFAPEEVVKKTKEEHKLVSEEIKKVKEGIEDLL